MDVKKNVVIFLIILSAGIFLPLAHSGTKNIDKLDVKVAQAVSADKPVRVIVTLNNEVEKKFGIFDLGMENVSQNDVLASAGINKSSVMKYQYSNSFSAQLTSNEIKKLEQDSRVKQISYDYPVHITLQNSLTMIKANNTWAQQVSGTNLTGKGESVCILDTGVDYNHTDLGGGWGKKVIAGFRSLDNSQQQQDCGTNHSACFDDNGHGTHVAGIVAANGSIKGVAPDAKIVAVKVLNASGAGDTSDIIAGIEWCVHNATKFNISAISMSLGTSYLSNNYCNSASIPMTDAINAAVAKNISVVIASGNDANYTDISFPACIQNATAVGAVYDGNFGSVGWGSPLTCTDTTTYSDKITCFTDRNSLLKLLAPGAIINSTWNNGSYKEEGGTSMATPYVSGTIAIMKQYLKLQNKTKTTQEIENILQKTGKQINDSKTNLNFSRINVYQAVSSLDETPPVINLISPINNTINNIGNTTFNCNATDDFQIANLTLKIWNSSSLYYNKTLDENNSVKSLNLSTIVNLQGGDYKWGCEAYDNNSNIAETFNLSLTVPTEISVTLNSPTNNKYTNSSLNFTCTENTTKGLTNSTFLLWNSTSLIYNKTLNITGTSNQTTFNYTFSDEGNYSWNCKAYNNVSNSTQATSNHTVIYDITPPNITIISPNNLTSYTGTTNVVFKYNVSDANIDYCNLSVGDYKEKNNSINTNLTNQFTKSLSTGKYEWNILCADLAGNTNSTGNRTLTIKSEPSSSSSSGGGGGGSIPITMNYNVNISSPEGSTNRIMSGDTLSFSINNTPHKLTLIGFQNSSALILIQSTPVEFQMRVNETKKISLYSKNYYDLEITLNSIKGNYANFTLKKIHEPLPLVHISNNTNTTPTNTSKAGPISGKIICNTISCSNGKIISIIVLIVLLVIFFSYKEIIKNKKTEKKIISKKSKLK